MFGRLRRKRMQDDFEAWVNDVEPFLVGELGLQPVPRPLPPAGSAEARVVLHTLTAALHSWKGDTGRSRDEIAKAQEFLR
jgi:hypothetical protein